MRELRKVLFIMITFILIVSIFVGCNYSNKWVASETASLVEKQATEDEKSKVSKLKIMVPTSYLEEERQRDNFYWKLDIFKSEHKNVKEIQVEEVPWEQLALKYILSFNVKESPDIVLMGDYAMRTNIVNNRFYPLNEFINKNVLKDWEPSYVKSISLNGDVYGYMRNTDIRVIYYNKDIFNKAGLDPDKHPETWDDLIEYAEKTNHVLGKDQYGYGFVGANTLHTPIMWSILVLEQSSNITDEQGRATFDKKESIKAAEFYSNMINKYRITPKSVLASDETTLLRDFLLDKYAMILGGSWQYSEMKNQGGVDINKIGWFEIPVPKGGKPATIGDFWSFCISSQTKNPKLAYELLSTIANEVDIKAEAMGDNMWIPTRKSWVGLPAISDNTVLKGFTEYSQKYAKPSSASEYPIELYGILNDALQKIWDGASAAETLKQAAKIYNDKYYLDKLY